jgi:LmbE family N-acetylglucosaminyl deacetylase
MSRRTILGVFAHPDDESMGPGGTLAKYAALGHRVVFVTATEGGAGRLFTERPEDKEKLKAIRRRETEEAALVLGIEFLGFLGFEDRQLAQRSILEIEETLAAIFRRERPDVVITFHGSGISRHPDHRVIALATMGAFRGAAWANWYGTSEVEKLPPHAPAKLYEFAPDTRLTTLRWPREIYAAKPEEVTTAVDTRDYAETRWRAIQAHESQRDGPPFRMLYESGYFDLETFVRVFPSPPPGEGREEDLLAGLA